MTRVGPSVPPFKPLAAALRLTTETLAHELAQPTRAAPQWSVLEWRIAAAVAALQGNSALLATRLLWRGPDRWQEFLAQQAHHTRLRRQRIAGLLEQMHGALRAAGVAVVALKGAALYQLGLYPQGERPMGDIDLLARPEELERAARALQPLGFRSGTTTWRHLSLEPEQAAAALGFGEHIDNPIKIEIHTRIAERLPVAETDITALQFPSSAAPGLNAYPSGAALMRHLLLHAAGNMRARALRNVQLHDVALLGALLSENDWSELLNRGVDARGLWWALAPLSLTRVYYPDVVPATVLESVRAGCPALLRRASRRQRLSDVSWSRLGIQAFPGIEWSASLAEATRFIRSRVWPDRAALAELELGNKSLGYAATNAWYTQSHALRILRWALSRPPRVQTLHSVRQALAPDGSAP